jgi:hypothetical protein
MLAQPFLFAVFTESCSLSLFSSLSSLNHMSCGVNKVLIGCSLSSDLEDESLFFVGSE